MMDVGVDPFISSVRQINGEVCNSPKTIKNIGAGVLFTTDKGLMAINNMQVDTLSADFEHEERNDYAVRHNRLYQKAIALLELGKPGSFVSTVPFMNYLVGSNIGYDYPNREIWVNNPAYPYSYVFSMDYKTWSKRDETFTTIVADHPRYYAQQQNRCKNLSAKEGSENINIFLLSNPVKIGLDEFKQFRRIVARGEFPVEHMGMYLFGSIDGYSWAYIGGKEIVPIDPVIPGQFEQMLTVDAFQQSFIGGDGKMYFLGASDDGLYRLDDDGEIRKLFSGNLYPPISDKYGNMFIMVNYYGVYKISRSGEVTGYHIPGVDFVNMDLPAVQTLNGHVTFFLRINPSALGGILVSSDYGVAPVMIDNLLSTTFVGYFRWNNTDYFASVNNGLWSSTGGVYPDKISGLSGISALAEGQDGKLYLTAGAAVAWIAPDGTMGAIDFGLPEDLKVYSATFVNTIDGKLIIDLYVWPNNISHRLYRIDDSGNPVYVMEKHLYHSIKGHDGKIYIYSNDGLYRLDDDYVLHDMGIDATFSTADGRATVFNGKTYFFSTDTIFRLEDDGSIVTFANEFVSVFKEVGGRLYCHRRNNVVMYINSDGVLKYAYFENVNAYVSSIDEVYERTYFSIPGAGLWYIDGNDEFKPTNLIVDHFKFMGYSPDGMAWFAAPGTRTSVAYYATKGIFRLTKDILPTIKAKDAIYLGAHKSAKYAAAVIEGVVTHEWNLTHISETVESTTNKKLR
jgi:hypothetical protein